MKYLYLLFICLSLLLMACGGAEPTEPTAPTQITEQPVATSATDTAVPTNTIIPATVTSAPPVTQAVSTETAVAPPEPPTPTPPLLAATEPSIQVISGQLPDGAFFLGDVNAPITVIDYSDFL